MAQTPALVRLQARIKDAERLIEIHEECTGRTRGRRHGYDALNRSAVTLSVTAWEAFVEDLVEYGSAQIGRRLRSLNSVPDRVRDPFIRYLHEQYNLDRFDGQTKDLISKVAGSGWRLLYIEYVRNRINSLNTPNYKNCRKLVASTVGLEDFGANWGGSRWPSEKYISKLDNTLDIRHKIAHGRLDIKTVGKGAARDSISLVRQLATWSESAVFSHVQTLTNDPSLSRVRVLRHQGRIS
jgi:hypothetical protein